MEFTLEAVKYNNISYTSVNLQLFINLCHEQLQYGHSRQ